MPPGRDSDARVDGPGRVTRTPRAAPGLKPRRPEGPKKKTRMNTRDAVRLLVMTALFGANLALSELAAGAPALDPLETVQLGAAVVLWSAAYVAVGAAACRRPILKPLPAMTVANVWALAYGLGLLVFVTVYAALGVNSCVSLAFVWALTAVACDDLVTRSDQPLLRTGACLVCLVLALAATMGVSAIEPDKPAVVRGMAEGQWSSLAGGLFAPVLAPFLYSCVRERRHYPADAVLELIQFAMPFAIVLSLILLVTLHPAPTGPPAYLEEVLTNYTLLGEVGARAASQALDRVRQIQRSSYLIPLAPLTALPTVYFAVQTPLLYATTDLVACFALALAAREVWRQPAAQGTAFVACAAAAAMLARGVACYADPDSHAGRAFPDDPDDAPFVITEFTDDAATPMLPPEPRRAGPRQPPPVAAAV